MAASGNYVVESDINNWSSAVSATETFATGAVNILTDRITITNDVATGTELVFSSTGEVPGGLVQGTTYFANRIDATTIEVCANPVNAADGTQIDLTDVGSGTHTLDIGSGSSTVDRQAIIDQVEQMIEKVCEDVFYSKAFVVYKDGNGKNRLNVGEKPSLLTVTEVSIAGVVLNASWWTSDDVHVYLDPESVSDDADDLAELHLRMRHTSGLFPKGMSNIKITGTEGWTTTPDAVTKSAIIMCRYENDNTLYTRYEDLDSDKLGDASYTRGKRRYMTGIHEADRLLMHLIRNIPKMGVA
ncbi:hypothetical protein KAR91_08805 [Candidatus Pacearchaeota archaeon]|nr:hypothetical protein [Candidatus Pacearchaeota archaeon]